MMPHNVALANEQASRIAQDEDAVFTQLADEAQLEGKADGESGANPTNPFDQDYWKGYCQGLRHFWQSKYSNALDRELSTTSYSAAEF